MLAVILLTGAVQAQGAGSPAAVEQAEPASEAVLPPAEQLLDRMVVAMGGLEAFNKVKTVVSHGTLEMVGMGIKGEQHSMYARPDLSRSEITLEGLGHLTGGTGNGVAWEVTDVQGPRLLEGGERDFGLRLGAFDSFVAWRRYYAAVETLAIEEYEGRPCFKLQMTTADGIRELWWLDQETLMLVRITLTVTSPMGQVPLELLLGDYRTVDGVKWPFRNAYNVVGQKMLSEVKTLELNVEIDASQLAPPPQIQQLIDQTRVVDGSGGAETGGVQQPADSPESQEQ